MQAITQRIFLISAVVALATLAAPCTAQSSDDGIETEVHIIGFGMSEADRKTLEQAARDGGATFEHVNDARGLGAAIGAASGLSAANTLTAEVEPNNNFGHANDISPSGLFTATVHPKGDADWLRFRVNHQGELRLHSPSAPADIDLSFRLWNANRDVQINWASLSAGGPGVPLDLPSPGEYTLEVRDGRNDASSTQPYQLGFSFTPTADTGEPNNRFGDATPIAIDASLQANILPKGDSDWYRFEVSDQGQLELAIDPVPSNQDVTFRVWNAQRDVLHNWLSPLAVGGANIQTIDLPEAGTYTLELRDGRNDARAIEPYKLTLKFIPSADRGEPNNRFAQAYPVDPNGSIQATILPKGDSDWYRVNVGEQGQLDVAFDPVPANLDITFRVWNSNRDVVHNWRSPLSIGGPNIQAIDLSAPGGYWIEVVDGRNDARSISPYHLTLGFTPSGDSAESNDRFGAAAPIALGAVIQGTLFPKGDSDWYRIDAPAAGDIEVSITHVDKDLDLIFRVWNANRDVVQNWVSPLAKGGDTVGAATLKEAGRYFIELRDGRNDGRSIQPYTLTIRMIGSH